MGVSTELRHNPIHSNSNAYCYSDSNNYRNANCYAHTYAESDTRSYCNSYTHCYCNTNGQSHADCDAYCNTYRNAHSKPHAQPDSKAFAIQRGLGHAQDRWHRQQLHDNRAPDNRLFLGKLGRRQVRL